MFGRIFVSCLGCAASPGGTRGLRDLIGVQIDPVDNLDLVLLAEAELAHCLEKMLQKDLQMLGLNSQPVVRIADRAPRIDNQSSRRHREELILHVAKLFHADTLEE